VRETWRSLTVVLLAAVGSILLSISVAMSTAVQLLATTALIMGGTGTPSPPPQ
jgi:hypothetical protein